MDSYIVSGIEKEVWFDREGKYDMIRWRGREVDIIYTRFDQRGAGLESGVGIIITHPHSF
jgi:hypothetical protein